MTHRNIVFSILRRYGPLSDYGVYHVARAMGFKPSPSSVRTRRAELVKDQSVRDAGLRERTPSGRTAVVWEVA